MRIISLVPSWTETLIEAGITPVGRTRFCIHPELPVSAIPVVGGTKNVDWDLIRQLKPDLLILDREENPKSFSERSIPFWASHVKDGKTLQRDLLSLSELLNSKEIKEWSDWAAQIDQWNHADPKALDHAVLDVLNPWRGDESFCYVIWRNPWMGVTPNTYIAYVMKKLGLQVQEWPVAETDYPEIPVQPKDGLVYLFSSEPFPFAKKKEELKALHVKGAIVDGEKFSWFGIRSLRFLKEALQI